MVGQCPYRYNNTSGSIHDRFRETYFWLKRNAFSILIWWVFEDAQSLLSGSRTSEILSPVTFKHSTKVFSNSHKNLRLFSVLQFYRATKRTLNHVVTTYSRWEKCHWSKVNKALFSNTQKKYLKNWIFHCLIIFKIYLYGRRISKNCSFELKKSSSKTSWLHLEVWEEMKSIWRVEQNIPAFEVALFYSISG